MRLHLTPFVLTALCSLGLQACFIGPESPSEPEGKRTTLSMQRLDNGNLEYCDANGECQEVPYTGDCEVVEVDVDTSTGQTCERCVMEDGEVIDQGCGDVSVGCVVVTLPDPDCVVCAYVNGDVLFSSCVVDEAECTSDADCFDASGRPAMCVGGQCVEGPGCLGDDECPQGFFCAFDDATRVGTCLPHEPPPPPECLSDADCRDGMICQLEHYCPPCEDGDVCPAGPCEVFGFCVDPVPGECGPNQPCPAGMACEEVCECWADQPDSSGDAMPPEECRCYAMCVPVEPPPTECREDADCPNGYCELNYACDALGCTEPAGGFCVFPNCDDGSEPLCDMIPPVCAPGEVAAVQDNCWACLDARTCRGYEPYCGGDVDCAPGEVCESVCDCWDDPTTDPNGSGVAPCECYGVCVPAPPPPEECRSDADCPQGSSCLTACWDCIPEDPDCQGGCTSYCAETDPPQYECRADEDCLTSDGREGVCLQGVCQF